MLINVRTWKKNVPPQMSPILENASFETHFHFSFSRFTELTSSGTTINVIDGNDPLAPLSCNERSSLVFWKRNLKLQMSWTNFLESLPRKWSKFLGKVRSTLKYYSKIMPACNDDNMASWSILNVFFYWQFVYCLSFGAYFVLENSFLVQIEKQSGQSVKRE